MKTMKKIILIIAASFVATMGFAQEKAFAPAGFWDNWFIQGQAGGSLTISEDFSDASVGKLISPHVAISAGKYFSPELGARVQVGGWDSKGYLKSFDKTYSFKYAQANIDGLLNVTNLFMPYKSDRTFNFIAFLGLGYVHGFKKSEYAITTSNSIVPRGGIQFDFRLNDDLSFNVEFAGNLMHDAFNGQTGGDKYDGTVNALAGLTYRFNRGGFAMVDIIDPSQIKSLNEQINAQRSQLADREKTISDKNQQIENYKAELAKKPTVLEKTVEQEEVLMNAVVVFRLGSANLEQNQDINIYNVSKFMDENPKANLIITGYADKSTGTPAVNQRLSERRAQAVFDILTKKYNISASRLTVKASGDKEQLFPTDQWNRVVVFTAVYK